jgi:hypothetical protein
MLRTLPAADQLGKLEPVEAGHFDVEKYQGEIIEQQIAKRFSGRCSADQVLAEIRKNRFESEQILGLVIDKKHVRLNPLMH